jgi:tRNA (cmo5U34)-methyltransferase
MEKSFDFNTIQNFDEHILQSIPNYDILFNSLIRISDYFRNEKKIIYDIGCSTGNLLRYLRRSENYLGKMVGIDYSRNLLPENTREFDNINFIEYDLNNEFNFSNACLIFSIFTMQFLQRENRLRLLKNIYDSLCLGGALVIAEKTYMKDGFFQDIFTFSYYDYKKVSFSEKQILDKEKDLRTILKPNTTTENLQMIREVGFQKIECFYKYFQFEGWLCVK